MNICVTALKWPWLLVRELDKQMQAKPPLPFSGGSPTLSLRHVCYAMPQAERESATKKAAHPVHPEVPDARGLMSMSRRPKLHLQTSAELAQQSQSTVDLVVNACSLSLSLSPSLSLSLFVAGLQLSAASHTEEEKIRTELTDTREAFAAECLERRGTSAAGGSKC